MIALFRVFLVVFTSFSISERIKTCGRVHIMFTFDSIAQPIFSQIRNLRSENDRLANIRDTLLPRLMSGELDVSDVAI